MKKDQLVSKLTALILLIALTGSASAAPTDAKPQSLVAPSNANVATAAPQSSRQLSTPPPAAQPFRSLKMVSAADGWLVGEHGLIKRYIAGTWLDYPSPVTVTLNMVAATPTDAWVVGEGSTILHLVGNRWQQVASPVPPDSSLRDVDIVAPDEIWIIGSPAVMLHYHAGSWSLAAPPPTLGPISWGSPSDAWMVDGTSTAYHYSAGSWSSSYIEHPADSILMLSPEAGWIGTSSYRFINLDTVQYLRYTTSGWQPWPPQQNCTHADCRNSSSPARPVGTCQGETTDIYNLVAFTTTEFYATSDVRIDASCYSYYTVYYLWRNDVSSNQRDINLGETYTHTVALSGSSGNDLWMLGNNAIRHWDGSNIALVPLCANPYADVPASYYAISQIEYLTCRGIVAGTDSQHFRPNAAATRIQFAKLISLGRGWTATTQASQTFSDVPPDDPLFPYVEAAYQHGAISGTNAEICTARQLTSPCFLPNDPISRAQAAVITQQAFAWPIDTSGGPHFSDVSSSFYAYAAIETCYHHGVVNGIGGGYVAANQNITRAQIAVMLYAALVP